MTTHKNTWIYAHTHYIHAHIHFACKGREWPFMKIFTYMHIHESIHPGILTYTYMHVHTHTQRPDALLPKLGNSMHKSEMTIHEYMTKVVLCSRPWVRPPPASSGMYVCMYVFTKVVLYSRPWVRPPPSSSGLYACMYVCMLCMYQSSLILTPLG
jgi:hypothetical protein